MNEEKKQQIIALGRLGWSLRRIQRTSGVRRETAAAYLRAAGIALRPPGGWGRNGPRPAIEVITDSPPAEPSLESCASPVPSKPANEVTTDFGAEWSAHRTGVSEPQPGRSPSASTCEPYRDAIEGLDTAIDVVVACVISALLGFHWSLLPTFAIELVPGLDAAPTWTGCVAYVVWKRKQQGRIVS